MSAAQTWFTVLGAVATVLASWGAARYAGRSSVKVAKVGDDTEFRRSLMERVKDLEERLTAVEEKSDARLEHINLLEYHIWRGNPPPPPKRPAGI